MIIIGEKINATRKAIAAALADRDEGHIIATAAEQVAAGANAIAWQAWRQWPTAWTLLIRLAQYHQWRNEASYASRRRTAQESGHW